MRDLTNEQKIFDLFKILGAAARSEIRLYLTGGATAVLKGWRDTTIDVDMSFEPEANEIYRALSEVKERLQMNIELASPSDFIPELPGWRDRSEFIVRHGKASFFHYDPYSQALSKIERGHDKDLADVNAMFERDMIEKEKLLQLFETIKYRLYRYPAIDPSSLEKAVAEIVGTD